MKMIKLTTLVFVMIGVSIGQVIIPLQDFKNNSGDIEPSHVSGISFAESSKGFLGKVAKWFADTFNNTVWIIKDFFMYLLYLIKKLGKLLAFIWHLFMVLEEYVFDATFKVVILAYVREH